MAADSKKKGLLSLDLLLEVGGVVLASTKNKKPDEPGLNVAGFGVDYTKLGTGMATVAAKRVFGAWQAGRKEARIKKAFANGLISREIYDQGELPTEFQSKRGRRGLGIVLIGAIVGAAFYVMSLTPEQRTKLFRQIDELVGGVMSFANELQGKPYSQDYEKTGTGDNR